MTVSLNNSTYDNCSICGEEYTDDIRNDTKKVVKLSCDHFFHIECISSWFSYKEKGGQDLSCGYCTQLSIPKLHIPNSFTQKDLTDFFEKIKRDAVSLRNHNLMDCIENLEPHSASLLNSLNNDMVSIEQENAVIENLNRLDNWVKGTIQKKFRGIAYRVIKQLYVGSTVASTLKEQVEHLASIPFNQWPAEAETNGFSVLHSIDGKGFRMRVSKQHMEREVVSYLSQRMKNDSLFEGLLEIIESDYRYDEQVIEAIPYAKNLQKEFSELLQHKVFSSTEEMLLFLQESIHKLPVKDNIKETVSLIIHKILFRRGALRTLSQEIKRWRETPIQQLPPQLRSRGVRVLDDDDIRKNYRVKNFTELLLSHGVDKRKIDAEGVVLSALLIGMVVKLVFKKFS